MGIRSTHTYAELELSKDAYNEIKTKLLLAGYEHTFMADGIIDMHGIGVSCGSPAGIVVGKKPWPTRS